MMVRLALELEAGDPLVLEVDLIYQPCGSEHLQIAIDGIQTDIRIRFAYTFENSLR
jgi:hypothetical protein